MKRAASAHPAAESAATPWARSPSHSRCSRHSDRPGQSRSCRAREQQLEEAGGDVAVARSGVTGGANDLATFRQRVVDIGIDFIAVFNTNGKADRAALKFAKAG